MTSFCYSIYVSFDTVVMVVLPQCQIKAKQPSSVCVSFDISGMEVIYISSVFCCCRISAHANMCEPKYK